MLHRLKSYVSNRPKVERIKEAKEKERKKVLIKYVTGMSLRDAITYEERDT